MFEKKVFISHSSKNKEIADHLCAFIARLGVKDENIFCSSVIGKGIDNGQQLNKAIADAITKSSLLIFILSYDFLSSSYCVEELGVGWFLAQRGDVTCYYLVLPDIDMSDILGFVNSKVDKFTFLDNNHVEDLSSLSCDLSRHLHIRLKPHNVITNAESVLLSSINTYVEQILEARRTRKYLSDLEEIEKDRLKDAINKANEDIEALKNTLLQLKQRGKEQDADIELRTIIRILRSLSYTHLKPKKPLDSLDKDFWFEYIERYHVLLKTLNRTPSDERIERVIAFVYLAIENAPKAYEHFLNFVKLNGRYTSDYDVEAFATQYSESMQEVLELIIGFHTLEREGMFKDDLKEVIEFLEKREEALK